MRIRTAVVGAGSMGNEHLRHLRNIPEIEVVALVDPYRPSAKATAEKHEVPATFDDVPTMMKEVRPEYVVVASPVRYHAAQAVAAFNGGAHVLVEKPLAMTIEEAEQIKEAALRNGRLFTMGFQMRQHSGYRALKQFIADGKLGAVFHSRVWGGHVMHYPWGRYFHKKDESMGGVVAATVVHPLDALYWILGAPEPVSISASMFCKLKRMDNPPIDFEGALDEVTVEDFAHAHVRFADGSSMSIEGDWLMHPTEQTMGFTIHATAGTGRSVAPLVELDRHHEVESVDFEQGEGWGDHTFREHVEFAAAIRAEGEPVVRFREALNVQKIMLMLYESAIQNREIRFD
jgi:predicted dehydrogenase